MYSNPQSGSSRQRDLLERAEQQRRAKRFRSQSGTEEPAESAERQPGRVQRTMARLRSVFSRSAR